MDLNFSMYLASAAEAWQSVPLMSQHLPFMGLVFSLNIWAVTTAIAVLVFAVNHSLNHSRAQAGNSALSGFRKSVSGFWNTQTLERVHLKWRQLGARSGSYSPHTGTSDTESMNALNSSKECMYTNRQPAAWTALSDIQGKTTVVWLSVQFFLLQVSNSFGLVPLCSAITGQAGFTLGMSIALLTGITFQGIKRQGMRFVRQFLPSGPSWPMAPLFIQLESISYGFRAISLGTRLYCNMFAGHLLLHLFTSQSQVPVFATPLLQGAPFTVIAAAILMALSALETIVAVLQSGVFCLLRGFYVTEVLRRKDPLASALSFLPRGQRALRFFFPTLWVQQSSRSEGALRAPTEEARDCASLLLYPEGRAKKRSEARDFCCCGVPFSRVL